MLLAVPLACSVCIYTDAKSVLDSLKAYAQEPRERARFRMAGRQWLSLIRRLIGLRDACGSTTELSWIKAHSDIASLVHIGNRCADELAKRASALRPSAAVLSQVANSMLPLEQEEVWLTLREWDSDSDAAGRLVTSDPRRHCFRRMEEVAAQETLSPDLRPLMLMVMRCGSVYASAIRAFAVPSYVS